MKKLPFYFLSFILALFIFSCGGRDAGNNDVKEKTKISHAQTKKEEPFTVMVQPLGNISSARIKFIQAEIKQFYHCDTVLIASKAELPGMAWYEPRKRYVADSLLTFLQKKKPATVKYVIGITDKDIATEKGDNPNYGIMGLGFCPGSCCVVSTFRLHKKILSKNKAATETIFMERFSKVCLHELGHNLGLPHCAENDSCFMNDADGTIAQVDRERKYICPTCKKKIGF